MIFIAWIIYHWRRMSSLIETEAGETSIAKGQGAKWKQSGFYLNIFLAVMVKETIPVRKWKRSVLSLLNLPFAGTSVVMNMALGTAQAEGKEDLPQNCRGWKGPRDIIGSNPHVGELGGNHVNSLRVMPWLLYYQSLWGQKVLCSVLEGWRWGITWHCCYRDGCFCLLLFSSHLMQLMTSDT